VYEVTPARGGRFAFPAISFEFLLRASSILFKDERGPKCPMGIYVAIKALFQDFHDQFALTRLRILRSHIQAPQSNGDLLLYRLPRKGEHFARIRAAAE
jgi:hypothetical protein